MGWLLVLESVSLITSTLCWNSASSARGSLLKTRAPPWHWILSPRAVRSAETKPVSPRESSITMLLNVIHGCLGVLGCKCSSLTSSAELEPKWDVTHEDLTVKHEYTGGRRLLSLNPNSLLLNEQPGEVNAHTHILWQFRNLLALENNLCYNPCYLYAWIGTINLLDNSVEHIYMLYKERIKYTYVNFFEFLVPIVSFAEKEETMPSGLMERFCYNQVF